MTRSRDLHIPAGKLPARMLDRLLRRYAAPPGAPGVVVGPSVGIDSAVLDPPPGYLIAKTDPITFTSTDIGAYAVQINANDIAVMGGTPRWFLASVLLPEGAATGRMAEDVFRGLARACRASGVSLCGGHTEITGAVTRTVVAGQMLGTVAKDRLVTPADARGGDALILTKGIAIEAASLIARELGDGLVESGAFTSGFIRRCRAMFRRPGVSVVDDARTAAEAGRVHAMHDPTEGGLATALHELADASGCGITVWREAIKVLPETRRLASHFGVDPMGLIASGSLLIAADGRDAGKIIAALAGRGIDAAQIGTVTRGKKGVIIMEGDSERPLDPFERDEITRIL